MPIKTDLYDLTYNSKATPIRKDGFLDVTDICNICNKRFSDWYILDSSKETIDYIVKYTETTCIIELDRHNHTWAHPLLAIEIARWADYRIGIRINNKFMRIKEGCLN